jgi:hypothetical protein
MAVVHYGDNDDEWIELSFSASSVLSHSLSLVDYFQLTDMMSHPQAAAAAGAPHTTRSNKRRRTSHGTSNSSAAHTSLPTVTAAAPEEDLFARQKVAPIRAVKSALSNMMAASNTTNPFSDLYSAISGRGVSATALMDVTVFFPFAREPAGEPMSLTVRKDATVEEVLGFGFWSYQDFLLFCFFFSVSQMTFARLDCFPSPKQRVENIQIQFRGVRRAGGQYHTRSV